MKRYELTSVLTVRCSAMTKKEAVETQRWFHEMFKENAGRWKVNASVTFSEAKVKHLLF